MSLCFGALPDCLMESIFLIEVRSDSLSDQNDCGGHAQNRDQSGNKSDTQVTFGDQGSELIDNESNRVTGSQLQTDRAPQPASALHL